MTRLRGPRRAAFTLIELLVVIAIMAALMGLLLSAVQRVRLSAKRTSVTSEISQLSNAIAAFKLKYGVTYIPSRIVLRENIGLYNNTPPERDSRDYLMQVWPRMAQTTTVNWSGAAGAARVELEGDQCLVFFLGGIPRGNPPVPGGFSKNPANPADANAGFEPPFFEFPVARLRNVRNSTGVAARYLSFIDPFDTQPYLYFSNYGTPNGYSKYTTPDTNNVLPGFNPYIEATSPNTKYYQSNGFQIISAGADRAFGAGGQVVLGQVNDAGKDNVVNFHAGQLSSAP